MSLVRVVIPTYNRAELLNDAIHSVLNQDFADFHAIVVDDGSTDETAKVVARWSKIDARVEYLSVPHGGVAAARNAGVRHRGREARYVAFLDADDIWQPDHLSRAIRLLESVPRVSIFFAAFETTDFSGEWSSERLEQRESGVLRPLACAKDNVGGIAILETDLGYGSLLYGEYAPHPSTTVLRLSAMPSMPWFDESLEILEDCFFFVQLASRGLVFAFDAKMHCKVRVHGDNLTGFADLRSPVTLRRQRAVLEYRTRLRSFCRNYHDRQMIERRVAAQWYIVGQCYAEQAKLTDARFAYLRSLRRPSVLAFRGLVATLWRQMH